MHPPTGKHSPNPRPGPDSSPNPNLCPTINYNPSPRYSLGGHQMQYTKGSTMWLGHNPPLGIAWEAIRCNTRRGAGTELTSLPGAVGYRELKGRNSIGNWRRGTQ